MTTYTNIQIRTLGELHGRLAEKGFFIFHLKQSKHPKEFLAFRRQEAGNQEDNAFRAASPIVLCRLFRGKVRIMFLESHHYFHADDQSALKKQLGDRLFFARKVFNPTRAGNCKTWKELVDQGELEVLV